jgi:uncharacterized membrane protein
MAALDQLRGLVMLLMTVDHASDMVNAGRFVTDAAWMWKPGSPIPAAQFVLRWVTHLCAPTFVFLAGVGIALSSRKRLARGESSLAIDRALVIRGLFIARLDPVWMSPVMMEGEGVLFQVLYAIGASMLLMAALRHLPDWLLCTLGVVICVASEACVNVLRGGHAPELLPALLLTAGRFPLQLGPLQSFIVAYPVLPWLALMLLGHACANWLASQSGAAAERGLRYAGCAALAVFALLRGLNAYGNMGLLRDSASPLQWLHVSKYPPSLTYVTLELGIAALLLSLLYRINERPRSALMEAPLRALTILGRAALFYYVLHIHLMAALTWLLGVHRAGAVGASLILAAFTVGLLSLPVARYQRHKTDHPNAVTRLL